jgi:hypothetical protein
VDAVTRCLDYHQNFALSNVVAQTVSNCSVASTDTIAEIYDLLTGVMTRSEFGYPIGATARLIKEIYQIRPLEEQITAAGYTMGAQGLNEDMLVQVDRIIQHLQIPLGDEIEMYMKQQEPSDIIVLPPSRTMARLHLPLFNSAAMIYLFCIVLRYIPSAVAECVQEVLANSMTFFGLHCGSVSIWPAFMAAVEAYTPESLALAEQLLDFSQKQSFGNREDMQRVVHQVWEDRKQLAAERQCDPGEVFVDWRDVMKRLDVDVLLL